VGVVTAVAGTVASALRFIAKAVLTGNDEPLKNSSEVRGIERLRGQITSERGLGRDIIVRFLTGVPGVNDGTVQLRPCN